MPIAGRVVLQMDQTAPAYKSIFRYIGERRENSDLDCGLRLRPGFHHQEASEFVVQTLRNPTDFEPDTIRKSII